MSNTENFYPTEVAEAPTEEIPMLQNMPTTVSGEIVVPDEEEYEERLTVGKSRSKIFEYLGELSEEDGSLAPELRELIKKHPRNEELVLILRQKLAALRNS